MIRPAVPLFVFFVILAALPAHGLGVRTPGGGEIVTKDLVEMAERGSPVALYRLGRVLAKKDDPAERKRGLDMLLKAAEMGHRRAGRRLLDAVQAGHLPVPPEDTPWLRAYRKDEFKTNILFKQSHERFGTPLSADINAATQPFVDAAEKGDLEAIYALCTFTANHQGYGMGPIGPCFKAAEEGYAKAQFRLGLLFHGFEEDVYFSVRHRHPSSLGIHRDARKARFWLEKAAAQGYAPAEARLAFLLHAGLGGEQDQERAARLAKKAADAGNAEGAALLGSFLALGQGGGRNYQEAGRYLSQAAKGGHRLGVMNLAFLTLHGLGRPQDTREAAAWLFSISRIDKPTGVGGLAGYGPLVLDDPDRMRQDIEWEALTPEESAKAWRRAWEIIENRRRKGYPLSPLYAF